MHLTATGIEAIERATLQAVPPEVVEELPGWLLPMDHGTVGRARSAVPLHHGEPDLALLPTILARYEARGFEAAFRLPEAQPFEAWQRELRARGFLHQHPTLTQTCAIADLTLPVPAAGMALDPAPDAAWMAMFLGDGLDPEDGACRSRMLSRATDMRYASVREDGLTLACGAASFGQGWLGVHGMRTPSQP